MALCARASVLALAVLGVLATLAGPALAGIPTSVLPATDGRPLSAHEGVPVPARDGGPTLLAQEGGEVVRGTLRDGDGDAVPGVVITISAADGTVIDTVETDDAGEWEVPLPGPGDYIAELDQDSLPDGAELRDPERDRLEFEIRTGQARTLIFALGEAAVGTPFTTRLLTQAVSGLRFGLIIAITAIGLSLVFGTTGLVNFSHGEIVTFGAVTAWFLNAPTGTGLGLQLIVAGLIATAATAALGGGIELGIFRPLRKRRTGLIQMLVISIGLMIVGRHLIQMWFGATSRPYFDYTIQQPWLIGPIRLTPRDFTVMLLAAIALVAVATMLQRTRIGKAMRAVRDNRDLAESSGIDVQRVILVVWILGAGLAGFGGVLAATTENVSFMLGFRLLLLMFAGVILGGLGTAYGAMVGSIVVGLVTEMSTIWFSSELKLVWGLFVLILILLVRPQGILGRRERIG